MNTHPVQRARPVGIWIRVSTEDQARGESPQHHEHRARGYAQSKGWEVIEVYRLLGISGKNVMEHQETERMLKDVCEGRIEALIFSKLARLARSSTQLLQFADIFQEHKAALVSLDESLDTSSIAGRILYTVVAAMAQAEREEIGSRVAASVKPRAQLGKPLGGEPPYGYKWQNKGLVPNPSEVPIRRLIHELYIQLGRKKAVASELNKRGYRTRKGKLWSDTSIEWLLRDPSAKGMHRKNYVKSNGPGKCWSLKPEEDIIHYPIDPIVSAEVWEEAFNKLMARRNSLKRPGKRPMHLFAGYVYCKCGIRMYVRTDTPKYLCQKCRNKVPLITLEREFHEKLRAEFASPERVNEYLAEADSELAKHQDILRILTEEKERCEKEFRKAYDLFSSEMLTKQQFGLIADPVQIRLQQINEELPRIQSLIDVLKSDRFASEVVESETKGLYEAWTGMNFEEKREIVESLLEKIVIADGRADYHLLYIPQKKSMNNKQRAAEHLVPTAGSTPMLSKSALPAPPQLSMKRS